MKKIVSKLPLLILTCFIYSCVTVQKTNPGPHHTPPGQLKKSQGATSAREYAPGQQKKHKN